MRKIQKLPKILVVVGPTASGKTDLAIKLAKRFNGEIVSADSRQIYRGMNIGTAKFRPNKKRMKPNDRRIFGENSLSFGDNSSGIRHHLVDIKNPDEEYTVAEFKRDAIKAIRGILRRNRLPILVGGTGLYVKAVVDNLDIPKVKANPRLRKNLELRIKNKGLGHLVKELLLLDPEAAYIVDLKNPRRVVRALEVALQTGKPFTAQRKTGKPLFDALQIGIKIPPEELRKRIDKRVDEMMDAGLLEEVEGLLEKYGPTPVLVNTIGYREIANQATRTNLRTSQVLRVFANNLNEVINEIKQNTWKYAGRQITWFKKDKRIKWVNQANAKKIATSFIKN